jgi:hypothetical protein
MLAAINFWDWGGLIVPPIAPPDLPPANEFFRPSWGARGNDYAPLTDEYWEHRAKVISIDRRNPSDIFNSEPRESAPRPFTSADSAALAALRAQRDAMAAQLLAAPNVAALKEGAARIRELDAAMAHLRPPRYQSA